MLSRLFPYKNIITLSMEIENADVILSINTSNVYELELKFSKPIPLDDMYEMYKYINKKIVLNVKLFNFV